MRGLVPDVNIEGHILALVARLRRPDMVELWDAAGATVHTFTSLGWGHDLADREVWNRCQVHDLVLVTDNRNLDGGDSLEAAIRDSVTLDSLPVLTVSDKDALRNDPRYAEQVAADLLEVLLDIKDVGRYRGVGRVFLPLPRSPR